jgi:hypothetical protein
LTLNSFGVSESKVASQFGEKLRNFAKPLVYGIVILLSIGKMAAITCRWRIMCLMETVTSDFYRIRSSPVGS